MLTPDQYDSAAQVEQDEEAAPGAEMVVNGKKRTPLNAQLARKKSIEEDLIELYESIDKGFKDSSQRVNASVDYAEAYNCDENTNQSYQGNAEVYVPLIHDAVKARKTRFTNQVFPANGHSIEVITPDGHMPLEWTALLEHYIEASKLRTLVVPTMFVNGDLEGQWNLYVTWSEHEREVAYKVDRPMQLHGVDIEGADPEPDVEFVTIPAMQPCVEAISDADVMILPHTALDSDDAINRGGSVTILRRWTKNDIKRMIKEGEIIKARGEELIDALGQGDKQRTDMAKKHNAQAGIVSAGKYALIYEIWTKLKVDGEKRLCVAYMGGPDLVLGVKQNPYWCNLCPLISEPVDKMSGVVKGVPPVKAAIKWQYAANDICNQSFDSATYAMMPIVMTDPMRNPRLGSMVMDLAAVWEVDPNATQFVNMPQLWKDGFEVIAACRQQVFQTLGVNPSMIPGQTGGRRKMNQAEVAQEQQVDILTTADIVTSAESVLTKVVQRFAWYDTQFRDKAMLVKMYGNQGRKAAMQEVEPLQMNTRYWFRWVGVEAARNAQMVQQQIGFMNVLTKVPPQLLPGRKINLIPIIERAVENVYGPRLAPLIFEDITDMMGIDPMEENVMLDHGFTVPVSPMDNDIQHLQVHQQLMQATGDVHGTIRVHMMAHMQQLEQKQTAQQPQLPPPGGGGGPGGGAPQPGASPAGPHAMKQPPGAVHPDAMPLSMPRKF